MVKSRQRIRGYTVECGKQNCLLLPAGMATIDSQIGARHVRTCWAEEEHSGSSKFFGFAEPAEHVLRRPFDLSFGVPAEELFDHGGDDIARRYGVDANTILSPFRG